MKLKELELGNLIARHPIVQGAMGVGVSLSNLAGAVAKEGGIGVLSAAQIGYLEEDFFTNTVKANLRAMKKHIEKARSMAAGGILGINIMQASRNYEEYAQCAIENGIDIIITGAGLPIHLPKLTKHVKTKIAPIVSSVKAAQVILKRWDKLYNETADMVIVEGPKAGGHLGFTYDFLADPGDYDKEFTAIVEYVAQFEDKYNKKIPVIFAGGVYTHDDIVHYMNLGASGVQMATRFVATHECDAHENFKTAYIKATKEDVQIIKSPVGMPGRALRNDFIEAIENKKDPITRCYQCLTPCNPADTPYCISNALIRAVKGDTQNSVVFCGDNVDKINEIVSVKDLMGALTSNEA